VQSAFPSAVLVLAGPDEFGLEASLRKRTDAVELNERIIFPGMVHGELKRQLLRRADLFCLPSDAEGFSMAVLEAMAASTAVLLSPGCHFPEVEQAGAGLIADLEPEAIASALRNMLSSSGRLQQMGQAAARFVAQRYSWDKITDLLLETYAEGVDRYRYASSRQ
jgi:glycosyltransferase involved in cell wall biosynthesis